MANCILCALDGFERETSKKATQGLCWAHYMREKRGTHSDRPIRPFRIDITGQRFGLLTVKHKSGSRYGQSLWQCICDCGQNTYVELGKLKDGHTKSCGCLRKMSKADLFLGSVGI